MKKRKVFWGVFFILAAVLVVVSKLGLMPDIGLFSVLATAFMAWVLTVSLRHMNFYGIVFSIAFIAIIYDEHLGIEALTPWTILIAAFFLSIGLSMVFGSKRRRKKDRLCGTPGDIYNKEYIYCENRFGSAIRYIHSNDFCGADLENHFGSLTVYLDNAVIQKPSAYLEVENHFGETVLYIPKEWKVQKDIRQTFGNVDEYGTCIGSSVSVLLIRGETDLGHIAIHYV